MMRDDADLKSKSEWIAYGQQLRECAPMAYAELCARAQKLVGQLREKINTEKL